MRCDHNDLSHPVRELHDILFHLTQMLSGEWSHKVPKENKYYGSILYQVGKVYFDAVAIDCSKLRGSRSDIKFHIFASC